MCIAISQTYTGSSSEEMDNGIMKMKHRNEQSRLHFDLNANGIRSRSRVVKQNVLTVLSFSASSVQVCDSWWYSRCYRAVLPILVPSSLENFLHCRHSYPLNTYFWEGCVESLSKPHDFTPKTNGCGNCLTCIQVGRWWMYCVYCKDSASSTSVRDVAKGVLR